MKTLIELQNTIESDSVPNEEKMTQWVEKALAIAGAKLKQPELTIRIVSSEESQQLNRDYRQKDKPTNVLSFSFEAPEMIPNEELDEYLGDLVICKDIVIQEAEEQKKPVENHWTHLIVHGVLHLLGFDHIENEEADEMETLETKILATLGIDDPYVV